MFFEEMTVYPRVIKTNTEVVIHGRFFDIHRDLWRDPETELKLLHVPGDGVFNDGTVPLYREYREYSCDFRKDGTFEFKFQAAQEGEYAFRISVVKKDTVVFDALGEFSCYALEEDLFSLRPYKGDTHVHTCFSRCGNPREEPSYVAAFGRERGLDFMFITDHLQQEPSIAAQDALKEFESAYRVYAGEECHAPRCKVDVLYTTDHVYPAIHQLSLGASRGVIKYTNDNFQEYSAFVDRRKNELDMSISEDERTIMAAVDWIVEKTREFGGVSVFCHPFWRPKQRLNLTPKVREYILENRKYDAVEVIGLGGSSFAFYEGNVRCMNMLAEAGMKNGRRIPVTGSTDSHNARSLIGYQYTLLFAPENSLEEVKNAIKSGSAVAVGSKQGEQPLVYGSSRLVSYAYFLLREFYPEHDEICAAEGKLMLQALRGSCSLQQVSSYCKSNQENLWDRFCGKN